MDYKIRTYPNTNLNFWKSKHVLLIGAGILMVFFMMFILFNSGDKPLTGNFVLVPEENSDLEDSGDIAVEEKPPKTYSINRPSCGISESGRIMEAFEIIAEQTDNVVRFSEDNLNGEIHFDCFVQIPEKFILASKGEVLADSSGNVINLYSVDPVKANNRFPGGCISYPISEISEILHVLGFDYSSKKGSIMYRPIPGCLVKNIDSEIIDSLKTMYS